MTLQEFVYIVSENIYVENEYVKNITQKNNGDKIILSVSFYNGEIFNVEISKEK